MTEDQKSRDEFEAWMMNDDSSPFKSWRGPWPNHKRANGEFWYGPVQGAFLSWQASRRTYRASDVSKNATNLDTLAERVHEARISTLEEAAKVCEDIADEYGDREGGKWPELKSDAQSGAKACENAVRALAAKTREGQ